MVWSVYVNIYDLCQRGECITTRSSSSPWIFLTRTLIKHKMVNKCWMRNIILNPKKGNGKDPWIHILPFSVFIVLLQCNGIHHHQLNSPLQLGCMYKNKRIQMKGKFATHKWRRSCSEPGWSFIKLSRRSVGFTMLSTYDQRVIIQCRDWCCPNGEITDRLDH